MAASELRGWRTRGWRSKGRGENRRNCRSNNPFYSLPPTRLPAGGARGRCPVYFRRRHPRKPKELAMRVAAWSGRDQTGSLDRLANLFFGLEGDQLRVLEAGTYVQYLLAMNSFFMSLNHRIERWDMVQLGRLQWYFTTL